jgi:FkbM family methyltransferase
MQKLSDVLAASLDNEHTDNFDLFRFNGIEKELVDRKYNFNYVLSNINLFHDVCDIFNDTASKDLYILLTAFKLLGHKKVKLPLSTKEYWETRERFARHVNVGRDYIEAGLFDWKLYLTDLDFMGIPIKQFTLGETVVIDFVLKQYEYNSSDLRIGAKSGDVIIDAGACWGNTALYFAYLAGDAGKVFSFEFTNNVEIFKKNISLNPDVAKRITLIEKALWKNSGDKLYFNESGPGTKVSSAQKDKVKSVQAISIDDFVLEQRLKKVDFIKMDIEGSEQAALLGAINTLQKYKPQLAIAIYHNRLEDFVHVPLMLRDLNLGYKFYLGHSTIYQEETVLFATV